MTIQERAWKIGMVVGVLLGVLLAVIAIKELKAIEYVGKNVNMTNTITVEGSGDAVGIPDVATFSFTVSETDVTVEGAQAKATEKTNAALSALKEAGIEEKDIQTVGYNIGPKYEYQNCVSGYCRPSNQRLVGYDVSQSVSVKIRDLKKAGSLFTTIGSIGVQNVGSLYFSVENPDSIKAEARAEAIAKAQEKAKALAKSLGVKLVRIQNFYESGAPMPYYGKGGIADSISFRAETAAVAPEIPVGEEKVVSNVTITYEIR